MAIRYQCDRCDDLIEKKGALNIQANKKVLLLCGSCSNDFNTFIDEKKPFLKKAIDFIKG